VDKAIKALQIDGDRVAAEGTEEDKVVEEGEVVGLLVGQVILVDCAKVCGGFLDQVHILAVLFELVLL